MTNLAHWPDYIDDALGGDFDGSLSGLCIMSLSFDFTRNNLSSSSHLGQSLRALPAAAPQDSVGGGGAQSSFGAGKSQLGATSMATAAASLGLEPNAFKKFKSSLSCAADEESCPKSEQSRIVRQLQQIENCLNTVSLSTTTSASGKPIAAEGGRQRQLAAPLPQQVSPPPPNEDENRETQLATASPRPSTASSTCDRNSPAATMSSVNENDDDDEAVDSDDDSTGRSTDDDDDADEEVARSPSPSSSVSTQHSRVSSSRSETSARSRRASDFHANTGATTSRTNKQDQLSLPKVGSSSQIALLPTSIAHSSGGHQHQTAGSRNALAIAAAANQQGPAAEQQVSFYSVREGSNLLASGGGTGGATLKESSYTTSVITTTAPMHLKSFQHHPFSLKQFPPSPYHQFSNSSLNHVDFYDKYLSHDSHQPLQTPLVGIERTQDLLSLKLPPHGPDEGDSQRFPREWLFGDSGGGGNGAKGEQAAAGQANKSAENKEHGAAARAHQASCGANAGAPSKRKTYDDQEAAQSNEKSFQFSYKSNSNGAQRSNEAAQREPINLNVSYDADEYCGHERDKDNMFDESMKHFNPDRAASCCGAALRAAPKDRCSPSANKPSRSDAEEDAAAADDEAGVDMSHHYHSQESMFGLDQVGKQKFQYLLAAPISIATKINEDTMTYLNQGQAYEIKLENRTDVSEAKKGFMCSIINIGFHERHMQQVEHELWQQWSQQHPNETIFSVDMKLSYNVFGVESDGLNKYEFLWDSSKAAGVFIRINSISTEFTPRKHGGEKGIPFKLSIETFSYNSKTHDSYFISAACCQIKVFKPKGAERKIRSDRDKVLKRPFNEQEKYHKSCEQTTFRECPLSSLHPISEDSIGYYRHSHGHFASKQVSATSNLNGSGNGGASNHSTSGQQQGEQSGVAGDVGEHSQEGARQNRSVESNDQSACELVSSNSQHVGAGNESDSSVRNHNSGGSHRQRDFSSGSATSTSAQRNMTLAGPSGDRLLSLDYHAPARLGQVYGRNVQQPSEASAHGHSGQGGAYTAGGHHFGGEPTSVEAAPLQHFSPGELQQSTNVGNQHRNNSASLTVLNNSQHFNMAYYNHTVQQQPQASHLPAHHHHHHHLVQAPPIGYSTCAPGGGYSQQQPAGSLRLGAPTSSSSYHQRFAAAQSIVEKPLQATGSQITPFRVSNLAISATSSNSHSSSAHFNLAHSHLEQCLDSNNHLHDQKDGLYSESGFEQPVGGSASQHCRQRSASTSLAIPLSTSTNCCANSGTSSQRQPDGYNSSSSSSIENQPNNWALGNQPTGSANSSCPSRVLSCAAAHESPFLSPYNNGGGGGGNNHHHHSEAQFQRARQTADESPPSCHSARYKNNSSYLSTSSSTSTSSSACARNELQQRLGQIVSQRITSQSSCTEIATWLLANRFSMLSKTFNNFSGSDLLRLSKAELIEICGLLDGIRLYNTLHNQPIKPRRVIYICREGGAEIFYPIYLYDVTLVELLREITNIAKTHFLNPTEQLVEKSNQKTSLDRLAMNSSSSTDSRSSIGDELNGLHSQQQCHRQLNELVINRLLVEGITPVKLLATEQVVQTLENESVWALRLKPTQSGFVEACISTHRQLATR